MSANRREVGTARKAHLLGQYVTIPSIYFRGKTFPTQLRVVIPDDDEVEAAGAVRPEGVSLPMVAKVSLPDGIMVVLEGRGGVGVVSSVIVVFIGVPVDSFIAGCCFCDLTPELIIEHLCLHW